MFHGLTTQARTHREVDSHSAGKTFFILQQKREIQHQAIYFIGFLCRSRSEFYNPAVALNKAGKP